MALTEAQKKVFSSSSQKSPSLSDIISQKKMQQSLPKLDSMPKKGANVSFADSPAGTAVTDFKQDLAKRSSTADAAMSDFKSGDQGLARTAGQTAGQTILAVGDAVKAGGKAVFRSLEPETQEKIKATAGTVGSVLGDIVQAAVSKHEKMKVEEPEKAAQVQEQIDNAKMIVQEIEADPKKKRDFEAIVSLSELLGVGLGKRAATSAFETAGEGVIGAAKIAGEGVEEVATKVGDGAMAAKDVAGKIIPSRSTLQGGLQTATEVVQRVPRAINRLKEGAKEASERAATIAQAEPAVAKAMNVKLDDRIINTLAEADDVTRKAYKQVVDIAEETPKNISAKRQPSLVSGELATKQFDLITKEKQRIGKQIGDVVAELPSTTTENIDDAFSEMSNTLSNQGIRVRNTNKGFNLDFSGSKFTPAERARIKELFNLATEGGDQISPKKIHAKDQLFSKLQREARMEGLGDILVETPDGTKSIFSVFRDIYSKKLEQIAPEIRGLNKQYRKYSLITDDIENSIFKTPNFNATKSADQAEFAKVNLRRIFGEAQSSPAFEAVADQMDALARELGYKEASPKVIAEFAQELRKLYPESIPKTGFTGGIRMGLKDIAEKVASAGAPDLTDQRKALIELLGSYLNP